MGIKSVYTVCIPSVIRSSAAVQDNVRFPNIIPNNSPAAGVCIVIYKSDIQVAKYTLCDMMSIAQT